MEYETYNDLVRHPFILSLLKDAALISNEVTKNKGFSVVNEYKRLPTEKEFYCLQLGHCISHLLIVIQQMEHTVLYMGNFSPTDIMKNAGITRYTHLLWSVENYIVRTQTVYDRLLIVIDRLFNLHNSPSCISHEMIVTNSHIKRTKIPALLKPVKNSVKKYYHDRNTIIHQHSFLDDELNTIEAYSILSAAEDEGEKMGVSYKKALKQSVKDFLKTRKREFTRINKNVCTSMTPLLNEIKKTYAKQYKKF